MADEGWWEAYGCAVGPAARPPVTPLAPPGHDPLAHAIRAVLVVGCLMVLSISHGVDPDLWGHVRYGPDARALWLAPPLFALWANAHGGFPAGLAVLALYLGCRALAALWSAGRAGWREAGRYGLVLAACGLATLANPYGPRLLAWLIAD